jgi:hypothetical protein
MLALYVLLITCFLLFLIRKKIKTNISNVPDYNLAYKFNTFVIHTYNDKEIFTHSLDVEPLYINESIKPDFTCEFDISDEIIQSLTTSIETLELPESYKSLLEATEFLDLMHLAFDFNPTQIPDGMSSDYFDDSTLDIGVFKVTVNQYYKKVNSGQHYTIIIECNDSDKQSLVIHADSTMMPMSGYQRSKIHNILI